MEEQSQPLLSRLWFIASGRPTVSPELLRAPPPTEKQLKLLGVKIPENPNQTGIPKREHHGTGLASDTAWSVPHMIPPGPVSLYMSLTFS